MIPKIIHYCWFGKKDLPEIVNRCIETWKLHCPDFKIMRWDETNSPVDIRWVKDTLQYNKYAFAADYVRFYVLKQYGGIYLDTDMFLIKDLNSLLNMDFFIGRESDELISFGVMGSVKNHEKLDSIISIYDSMVFDFMQPPVITKLLTPLFSNQKFDESNYERFKIYPTAYFYPIPYKQEFEMDEIQSYCTNNTIMVHLWNKSWEDEFSLITRKQYLKGYKEVLKKCRSNQSPPIKYYTKILTTTFKALINKKILLMLVRFKQLLYIYFKK